MPFNDLQSFIHALRQQHDLTEVNCRVDPYLEIAEIHRRVVREGGPALLFTNIKGSSFPVVTNLFGTKKRTELAFGDLASRFVRHAASLPEQLLPPTWRKLWQHRSFLLNASRIGLRLGRGPRQTWSTISPPQLKSLPALTTWKLDGGPFLTLPLVYTEHPETGIHNLGIYRMQIYSESETGLHMQIAKGGGFHLARAAELNRPLPVNVFLGGPPAAVLAAITPLPENVPELLLASLALGSKLRLSKNHTGPLPLLADAEFILTGEVRPGELRPEGPFGDHYGYYSLTHDFPVFHCKALLHRKNPIFPATVVGKPRQEDFYIGEYLQEMLSPLFPLVMPAVKDLWSYGETGFHSLATALVKERYKREAMVSGFRILGEGQLSLTKFLLIVSQDLNLKNFPAVLEHVLERADFRTDLYIFSNLSMDTLDYAGPKLNEGSKGILLGVGQPIRSLPGSFEGHLPIGITKVRPFCRGCLVVSGVSYKKEPLAGQRIAQHDAFANWPLIIFCDDADFSTSSTANFLWSTFTRFEPAADIVSKEISLHRFHAILDPPVVIDARMKPNYPDELECDEETEQLVDRRWGEYFP